MGSLSPWGPHVPARRNLPQVLRGEAAQTRQVPPGGSVELLHLLRQLLLEAPLLLVLLVSANFTTIGEEQPCGQTHSEEGLQPGPLGPGHSVSVGPSLNDCSRGDGSFVFSE